MRARRSRRDRIRGRILAGIVVSSFALKLALLVPAHATLPVRDSLDYLAAAYTVYEEGRYTTIRPPLYPLALVAARGLASLGGDEALSPRLRKDTPVPPVSDLDVARFVQVVFSTFTVWLMFLVGRALFDERAGLVAAGIFAFYPDFVGFSHLLWAETQLAMLSAAWFLLLVRGAREERPRMLLASGALLGLAALTRPVVLALLPVVLAWPWVMGPRGWRIGVRGSLAIALGAILTIAPWTARNAHVHGDFIPVSPQVGVALLFGVSENIYRDLEDAGLGQGVAKDLDWSRRVGTLAREIIRAEPARYARRALAVHLPAFWAPGSLVIEHLRWPWGYPAAAASFSRAVIALLVGSYLAVLLLGVLGVALAPRRRETLLVVGLVVSTTGVHMLVGGFHRHHLFLMVFFILYAGLLLSRSRRELANLWTPRCAAWVIGGLAALALVLSTSDASELVERWRFFGTRSDLRSASLAHADLRGADLRSADLRDADLREADLRGANLAGAVLQSANLRGANLTVANLVRAYLTAADLRGARGLDCKRLKQANYWMLAYRDPTLRCGVAIPRGIVK